MTTADALHTYETWHGDHAEPITLVGRIEEEPEDTDPADDCVTLVVLAAPSGRRYWHHGTPTRYIVRRASLRPSFPDEVWPIVDGTERELIEAEQHAAELRTELRRLNTAAEHAWSLEAAERDADALTM